jgi:acyl carrier protein phosphodiesterase
LNHLAHFLLAPAEPQALLGTLLADFQRGPVDASLPRDVARAVRLHRAIDSATDSHAEVLALKAAFMPGRRRFAGLALDLYFDHCLSRDWPRYAAEPLDAFVEATYAAIDAQLGAPFVPQRMRGFAAAMRDQDWLRSYATLDGVAAALGRLEHTFRRRFAREVDLGPLLDEIVRLQPACDATFAAIFPRLQRWAAAEGSAAPSRPHHAPLG